MGGWRRRWRRRRKRSRRRNLPKRAQQEGWRRTTRNPPHGIHSKLLVPSCNAKKIKRATKSDLRLSLVPPPQ